MAGPGKPGRRSKGPRRRRTLVLPLSLEPLVKQRAQELGCDVNAYVVQMLARDTGWTPDDPQQLPMPEAS